ncbi:MAG: hypothetical protein IKL24_05400 [Clostridia bacterium]|nr:hypothetical protein [Clostridia bacterium]
MERNKKIQIYCLFAASAFLGLFGAVCLYLGIFSEYDDAMGHFAVSSVFAPCAYLCFFAGPLLGFVGWIVFRGHSSLDESPWASVITRVGCAVAAVCVLASFILDINAASDALKPVSNTALPFYNVSRLFAMLSVVSFAVNALISKKAPAKPIASLLSFAPVIYCALKVMLMYFDQSIAVNSPVKLTCQLAFISYLLVFTAHTGLSLGRGQIFPRYLFTLCAAMAIGGSASIACLFVNLLGVTCAAISKTDYICLMGFLVYTCCSFGVAADTRLEYKKKVKSK